MDRRVGINFPMRRFFRIIGDENEPSKIVSLKTTIKTMLNKVVQMNNPSPPGGPNGSESLRTKPPTTAGEVLAEASKKRRKEKAGRKSVLEKMPASRLEEMLSRIRLGCFDHTAASCMGIAPNTYCNWIKRGKESTFDVEGSDCEVDPSGIYQAFYLAVNGAMAEAKFLAEAEVKLTQPFNWLRCGPGRGDWSDSFSIHGYNPAGSAGEGEGEIVEEPAISSKLLSEAFVYLETLGFIKPTEQGVGLFLDAESKEGNPEEGNGESGNGELF